MTDTVKLELQPLGQTIDVERGKALRDVLPAYGVEFPCGGYARCTGCRIQCTAGSLAVTDEQADILTQEELDEGWRLACCCVAEGNLTLHIGQWETVVLADHSSFEFTPRRGLGIAVDLGTTTVVAQLLDLQSGRVLGVRTGMNPHTAYGSDVMSRIQAAAHQGQGEEMTDVLRRGLGQLLRELVAARRAADGRLETIVLVGNTVMHHLFCGIDLGPLSHAPFETPATESRSFGAQQLGWSLDDEPRVRFLPNLGSFVGSDVLCGVLATKMHQSERPFVLVDLGTNGEIVVGNRERMLCASTAAGPAFEGGGIRMGMRAITGAISEVVADGGRLGCRVIGGAEARGICGSGLVDAVAAGLDLGLIESGGRLAQRRRAMQLQGRVALEQHDIRQLQLAKGAIAAGLRILRRRFGGDAEAAVPVYLAGAFGNYVNRVSARRIGLVDVPAESVEPAGNTALLGAKMALCANEPEEDFVEIRERTEHVALASDPEFEETFVEATLFPEQVVR
jgi:uncharacterized 2Fe-2S/4Fe-4S cluster protein (DUF4445 family)